MCFCKWSSGDVMSVDEYKLEMLSQLDDLKKLKTNYTIKYA